jgi:hypothetical protein
MSPDETKQVLLERVAGESPRGDPFYRFTLAVVGDRNGKRTTLDPYSVGAKYSAVSVKWSPDSRYVALIGMGFCVYECHGGTAVEVPLPYEAIDKDVVSKMKKYLKRFDPKKLKPDWSLTTDLGVRWTSNGEMRVTVRGTLDEPAGVVFKGEYAAVAAKDGHAECLSWEAHDFDSK